MEEEGEAGRVDLYELPEDCIANFISLTSPRDAGRSSVVSFIFKSAAESDIVWEKFLPSDYQDIVSRLMIISDPFIFTSKKQLYFFLSDLPILIDGGTKSFLLDKCTGKKIYMIGARELSIVWGGSPQYWTWKSLPESRFPEVAELNRVCWLEIKGKMKTKMLSPNTTYAAYLVMKLAEGAYGFEHPPAEVVVNVEGSTGDEHQNEDSAGLTSGGGRAVYLDSACALRRQILMAPRRVGLRSGHVARARVPLVVGGGEGQFPRSRGDGWMEVEMGEFYNKGGGEGDVHMCLTEIKGGHWKTGLIVQGIELRPIYK